MCAGISQAAPLAPQDVPEPLRPWVDWVLRGHEEESCSLLYTRSGSEATRVCAWPSRLALDLGETRGSFRQDWSVERRIVVPLPGSKRHWPQDVRVDGRPAPVASADGHPGVELPPGTHSVRGVFRWDSLPELIQIPPQTALLSLALAERGAAGRTRAVPFPNRDAEGRLWLRKRGATDADQESRVDLIVHRRLVDSIPLVLETRVALEVSGRSREVLLGRALPDGFVPMSLASPLPARLEPDGRLRVQLRPGRFDLRLTARHLGAAASIERPASGEDWAKNEVWVFEARPDLRLVVASGEVSVDPQQTSLPDAWKSLPAWLIGPGDRLDLVEKRRGDAEPAPDLLALDRTWWLDFDGRGYTIKDRIEGEIRRSSRLEMAPAVALGRVELNGRDQFITRAGDREAVGIEIPRGAVKIAADSRIAEAGSSLPAVGWEQDFQSLAGALHLPPGWRLLHASGVDRVDSTWLNRWTLLDLFTALIIVLAFGRLWGPIWGVVAGLGMALSYTEPGAPQWAWLAVLLGEALGRTVPSARFASWIRLYRGLVLAMLVVFVLPFVVTQVRTGLHPALERPSHGLGTFAAFSRADEAAVDRLAILEEEMPQQLARAEAKLPASAPARSKMAQGRLSGGLFDYADHYAPDPGARITTGPGLPAWTWHRVALRWNGPVERGHELRLFLVPPFAAALLAFLRVALVGALVVCVLRVFARAGSPGAGAQAAGSAALALAAATLVIGGAAAPARADLPSDAALEELRTRLLAPPDCAPRCATSPQLALDARPGKLVIRFEVDALAETGVPLPGGARSWLPEQVRSDGVDAEGLRLTPDGTLWLRVAAGRHAIEMRGPLPEHDTVELTLPLRPHRVEARLTGWTLQGLLEDGRAEGSLQLTRAEQGDHADAQKLDAGRLPPFAEVTRNIRLGLTWQVATEVRRLTPGGTAVLLEVPLLPGEAVTTAGLRVEDGHALVQLDPGARKAGWTSTLPQGGGLELVAPDTETSTEVWRLDVSPIWHVDTSGIPVVHQASASAARVREWRPWPGEKVRLDVSRPTGVEGSTTTIDATSLRVEPGLRATDATLTFSLRSSRGGEHRILLPEGAELARVTIREKVQPIRQEQREVRIPIVPGAQVVSLAWREPRGISGRFAAPDLDLGADSVNATLEVVVPASRWTLLVFGPQLGPAVLFWSYLAVLLAVALALARIPATPLRFHHWLLLGLGLTQVPLWAAAVVVAWLLALGYRREYGLRVPGRWFDLAQLGLVWLTFAAALALIFSIRKGLLGLPEMQIAGNDSTASLLRWYQDRAGPGLIDAQILSVPLLVYRLAMLAWALWLAQALLGWVRWGWDCFTHGELWRPLRTRPAEVTAEA